MRKLSTVTPSSGPDASAVVTTNNANILPSLPTSTPRLDSLSKYNKYIIGGASTIAFVSMLYTVRQQTKGRMRIPLQELLENPAAAAANPKLAAYAFAGRAFSTATILVASGGLMVTMGVASILQVNSLKEFSEKLTTLAHERLPQLQGIKSPGASQGEDDGVMDADTYDFLKEVQHELKKERNSPPSETTSQRIVSDTLRESLGPFKPNR
ncbi:hypothetical protein SeMB42_g02143 [Synchytrium endobioticum]|uniref:Altered inheritance of mitochondria protein 11 n=1 Tax=Synchytrium endobioticum TaxID=286115 RepID=A0A507DGL4_9FUNG|nr:hypothetical protein SeMB42_g02143 [Synchytrium endobioticum]